VEDSPSTFALRWPPSQPAQKSHGGSRGELACWLRNETALEGVLAAVAAAAQWDAFGGVGAAGADGRGVVRLDVAS